MAEDATGGLSEDSDPKKACSKCGVPKPLTDYYRMASSSDGRRPDCKSCISAARSTPEGRGKRARSVREARHRKWAETGYQPRKPSGLTSAEQQRLRRARPGAEVANRQNEARKRDKMRKRVFDHYGWSCACCGSTKRLTIDHIDGTGGEHRKELFGRQLAGWHFYRWLIRHGFPDGYQTLCFPCNLSKRDGDRCRLNHRPNRKEPACP
jgi:hypothetical protein